MTSAQAAPALITGDQLVEMMAPHPRRRQRRAQADDPGGRAAVGHQGARMDPLEAQIRAGLLLRHARPGAPPRGRRRPRAPRPGQGRRLRREAAAGRPRRSAEDVRAALRRSTSRSTPCPAASSARAAQGRRRPGGVLEARARGAPAAQDLLQGAARVLRRARARGRRARRPARARADLRPQAEVGAGELRARLVAEFWLYPDGSRILELSTQCPPARRSRSRPRRGRSSPSAGRPRRRAADEDAHRARVLRQGLRTLSPLRVGRAARRRRPRRARSRAFGRAERDGEHRARAATSSAPIPNARSDRA